MFRRAAEVVTKPFGYWIPAALLVATVSCAPPAAAIASPSPSVSSTSVAQATPVPGTPTPSLVAPTRSTSPTAPPTGTAEPAPASGTEPPGQKLNLDEIAPPGRERDLILENCGTCHSWVCAFRGQRTLDHWQTIKQDMRDKVSQINDRDYDGIFAYLEMHFNDQAPEPQLPPDLQQLGCSSGVR